MDITTTNLQSFTKEEIAEVITLCEEKMSQLAKQGDTKRMLEGNAIIDKLIDIYNSL